MSDEIFSDGIKGLEKIENDVSKSIYTTLGLSAKVKLVEPKTIARSEGKAKRIIDKRNLK